MIHHIAQPGNAQIAVVDDDAPETAALGNMNLADFRRLPGPGSQSFEKYTAAMVERQTTGVYPRRRSHARTGRRRSRTYGAEQRNSGGIKRFARQSKCQCTPGRTGSEYDDVEIRWFHGPYFTHMWELACAEKDIRKARKALSDK